MVGTSNYKDVLNERVLQNRGNEGFFLYETEA